MLSLRSRTSYPIEQYTRALHFGVHRTPDFLRLCSPTPSLARSQWRVSASAIERVLGQRVLHQLGPRKPTPPPPPLRTCIHNLHDFEQLWSTFEGGGNRVGSLFTSVQMCHSCAVNTRSRGTRELTNHRAEPVLRKVPYIDEKARGGVGGTKAPPTQIIPRGIRTLKILGFLC